MPPGPQNGSPPLTWAEIDLKALAHNCRELRRVTSPGADLMAVVKADGYGHGACQAARTALDHGARFLGVARFEEAVQLRAAGFGAPILVFGHSLLGHVAYLAGNDIRASVSTVESARQLSEAAVSAGKTLKVHLKIDTGMGRLGLLPDALGGVPAGGSRPSAIQEVLAIASLPHLEVEGIYTHFANADTTDKTHVRGQFVLFMEFLEALEKQGFQAQFRHAANSAATITLPETHLDMVRLGIALYGLRPSEAVDCSRIHLKPVLSLKSTVIQVKTVGPGFSVGYGSTHRTSRFTQIATVPIGYADGFDRKLSSRGHMLVKGVRAPIIGRVCMDLTLIDVGHISGASLGDEVVILGRQGEETISAEEIAEQLGTIHYEVVSSLTSRVARICTP